MAIINPQKPDDTNPNPTAPAAAPQIPGSPPGVTWGHEKPEEKKSDPIVPATTEHVPPAPIAPPVDPREQTKREGKRDER